jgi:hypothetical protein
MATDNYLAICESGDRTCRMFAALYPELAMKFGDDPRFKKLAIAVRDLRMDLPRTPGNALVDEPCLGSADE